MIICQSTEFLYKNTVCNTHFIYLYCTLSKRNTRDITFYLLFITLFLVLFNNIFHSVVNSHLVE